MFKFSFHFSFFSQSKQSGTAVVAPTRRSLCWYLGFCDGQYPDQYPDNRETWYNVLAQRCPRWFWLEFCFSPPCKQCKPCLSRAWDNLTPCHLPLVCFVLAVHCLYCFFNFSPCSGVWLIDCHILSSPVCWTLFSFRATCLLFHCLLIWPQFSPAPPTLRINCANNWLQLAKKRRRRVTPHCCVQTKFTPRERPHEPSRTGYDHLGRGVWPWASD